MIDKTKCSYCGHADNEKKLEIQQYNGTWLIHVYCGLKLIRYLSEEMTDSFLYDMKDKIVFIEEE